VEPERVRSFTLLGASGSGKTSLAEALLFRAGVIHHRADGGGSVLDSEPEEAKRQLTLFCKLQSMVWDRHTLHLADTPGLSDFVGNAIAPLSVLDVAVIVVDSGTGVDVATKQLFDMAVQRGRPVLFFVNKMDKEQADFGQALESIRTTLTKHAHPVVLPIGQGSEFQGVMDLVGECALLAQDGKEERGAIPDGEQARFEAARNQLIEEVAGTDEELLEKFAEGEQLRLSDVLPQFKQAVAKGDIVPVLSGTANPDRGTGLLLDSLIRLVPGATELPPPEVQVGGGKEQLKVDASEPAVAQVFKVTSDPGVGDIFFLKVVTGTIKSGDDLINTRSQDRERMGHLLRLLGKERKEVPDAVAGDVIAVAKLKSSQVGDTLAAGGRPVELPPLAFPNPVHSVTVLPKTRKDQDRMGQALAKLAQTDQTLRVRNDPEFNETILEGMGEVHLEIVAGRLREKYGVELELGLPHVPYRQTITRKAQAQGRHKKQTGGHGQFGDVHIRLEPLPPGGGFEFVDEIKGGVVPAKFVPSVEAGIRKAMQRGALAGYPVVDLRATLFDGSYHSVDSSDIAFQLAGSVAFRKCEEAAGPVLLEPIMRLEVTAPAEYVGAITNDLNSRRGKILGMDQTGDLQVIRAEVPMAETFRYSTDLRSITQGAGSYRIEFAQYEQLPRHLTDAVIEQAKADREKREKERPV
jgi:elongation factor G